MTTERFGSLVSSIYIWVVSSLYCRLQGIYLHYSFHGTSPSDLMNYA
jgi:hypothetical protein